MSDLQFLSKENFVHGDEWLDSVDDGTQGGSGDGGDGGDGGNGGNGGTTITLTSMVPTSGDPGTPFELTGTNLAAVNAIDFDMGQTSATAAAFGSQTDTTVQSWVPSILTDAGDYTVTARDPDGHSNSLTFTLVVG